MINKCKAKFPLWGQEKNDCMLYIIAMNAITFRLWMESKSYISISQTERNISSLWLEWLLV
jgi:hypothetical protein